MAAPLAATPNATVGQLMTPRPRTVLLRAKKHQCAAGVPEQHASTRPLCSSPTTMWPTERQKSRLRAPMLRGFRPSNLAVALLEPARPTLKMSLNTCRPNERP